MKGTLASVAWVLVGLLALAAGLISLGQRETNVRPSIENYGPSGTAALANLLTQNGYRVERSRSTTPPSGPKTVVIAFSTGIPSQSTVITFMQSLENSIRAGGRAVYFALPEELPSPTAEPASNRTVRRGTQQRTVTVPQTDYEDNALPATAYDVPVWDGPDFNPVLASRLGNGVVSQVTTGLIGVNRYIDRADNAEVALSAIRLVARPGDTLVFTESSYSAGTPEGLLKTVGAWAEAAWLQLLFLLGIVIITLGRRFGLPEEPPVVQRGARELLDAIADTHKRARATQTALAAAAENADAELRRILKLPRDASEGERNRLLPESLQQAFARIRAAETMKRVPVGEAVAMCQALERELADFLGETSVPLRRPAKSR